MERMCFRAHSAQMYVVAGASSVSSFVTVQPSVIQSSGAVPQIEHVGSMPPVSLNQIAKCTRVPSTDARGSTRDLPRWDER